MIHPETIKSLEIELRSRAKWLLAQFGSYSKNPQIVEVEDVVLSNHHDGFVCVHLKGERGHVLNDLTRYFDYLRAIDVVDRLRRVMVLDDLARL